MNSLFTIALMFKVLDSATAPVRKINETLDTTGKNLDKAAGKSSALNSGIERLGTGAGIAGRVAAGVEKIGKAAEAATAKLDALQKKTEKLGESAQKLDGLGRPLAAAGAVGALGIEKTIEDFANLEEAQKRLRTTLMDETGKVGDEYERLNALAEKLGTDLPGSTKDMVQMFIALREQGVQTKFILGGTGEAAAKFAALMKLGFAESATHVAKFSEAMGVPDKEMVKFMDLLQRLKYASGVEVGDLAYTFKYAGGALKLLGLQGLDAARDFSTIVGVLASAGIEGSTAGTNMAQALSRMAEIGHKLDKKAIKKLIGPILDKYNVKLDFFTESGEFKGLRPMVAELEKLKALNPQEQIIVLKKLFEDEAARPLAVLLKAGISGYDDMLQRIQKQADMEVKIKEIMSGTKMQWETMTGTVQNFTAHIGGVFAKLINLPGILTKLNDLFAKLDSWVLLHPKTAGIIAGVVLGIVGLSVAGGALLLTLAGLGAGVPRALEALTVLGRGATWTAGRFTALYMAMRRKWIINRLPDSMFGDVIPGAAKAQTGIRGVISTTRLWMATQLASIKTSYLAAGGLSGLARSFSGGLVTGIRSAMIAMRAFSVSLLTNPVGWIALAIAAAAFLIYKYWQPIKAFFQGVWQGLKAGFAPVLESLKTGFAPLAPVFKSIGSALAPIITWFKNLFGQSKYTEGQLNKVTAAGIWFGKALAWSVKLAFAPLMLLGMLITWPFMILNTLVKKLFGLNLFQAGANIFKTLTEGMKSMLGKPVEVMKSLVQKLRNFLPFSPAKEGPLRDINRVRIVETIAESMRPAPMVKAMRGAAAATMLAATVTAQPVAIAAQPVQQIRQAVKLAAVPSLPEQTQQIRQMIEPVNKSAIRPALPVADLARPVAQASAKGGGAAMQISFSPQITIQGGGNAEQLKGQVNEAMKLSFNEFERMMKRYEDNRSRKGFA